MTQRLAIGLIGVHGASAAVLVAAHPGAPAAPGSSQRPSLAQSPLEFLVVGIARDMNKKNDLLATPPQRLGGPGRVGVAGRGRGL
jgi:hypothetical protein